MCTGADNTPAAGGGGIREMEVGRYRCREEYGKEAEVVLPSILIDANQRRSRLAHAQQKGQKNMEVCSEIHQMGVVSFHMSF